MSNAPYDLDDRGKLETRLRPDSSVRFSGDLSTSIEKGVFASLLGSLHYVFSPPQLPPLELTSTPIPVLDRMAVKRDPKATVLAIVINGLILACILVWGTRKVIAIKAAPVREISLVDPLPPPPPKAPPKVTFMGGGGGQKSPTPVALGNPPKFDPKPLIAPTAPPKIQARLIVQPAIDVPSNLKMAKVDMPNIGMANTPVVAVSMGNGAGAGLGSGSGSGMGPGTGGNYGDGVFKVGGGISQPQVLYAPDPQFSEEARKAKLSGTVVVYLQVNQDGRPMHVRVVRGLGMGLDEKAVEVVRLYKFKAATKDGHPVIVEMNVEVNFQIF